MTSKRHHGIAILPVYLSVAFFFLGEEEDGVSSLTLIRLGFLKVVFSGDGVNRPPSAHPSIFQKELI